MNIDGRAVDGPSIFSEVLETALRRQLTAELAEMREIFNLHRYEDPMTHRIKEWLVSFKRALRSQADPEYVLEGFISLLQEILRDPISNIPFDADTYLGNDGNAYNHMSLCLYLHSAPAELRLRSPLNPENSTPFHVSPHQIVRHFVMWLERHNALLHSVEHERQYQHLMEQISQTRRSVQPLQRNREQRLREIRDRGNRASHQQNQHFARIAQRVHELADKEIIEAFEHIRLTDPQFDQIDNLLEHDRIHEDDLENQMKELEPQILHLKMANDELRDQLNDVEKESQMVREGIRKERIRCLRDQQKERLEQKNQACLLFSRQMHEGLMQDIAQVFNPLQHRQQQFAQNLADRIERLAAQDQESLQKLQHLLVHGENTHSIELQHRVNEAQQILERDLESQITHLESQIQELRIENGNVRNQINAVEQRQKEVRVLMMETELAIKKQEQSTVKQVLTAVCIVGAGCFATWAFQGVLSLCGAGFKGSVELTRNSLMLRASFSL